MRTELIIIVGFFIFLIVVCSVIEKRYRREGIWEKPKMATMLFFPTGSFVLGYIFYCSYSFGVNLSTSIVRLLCGSLLCLTTIILMVHIEFKFAERNRGKLITSRC